MVNLFELYDDARTCQHQSYQICSYGTQMIRVWRNWMNNIQSWGSQGDECYDCTCLRCDTVPFGRWFLDMASLSKVGGDVDVTPYHTKTYRDKLWELIQRIFFVIAVIKIATLIYCYDSIIIYNVIQNTGKLYEYYV